jgi:hypothetical protein
MLAQGLPGSGSGVKVLFCVRVYESESLRCNPAAKLVRSPDLWVCSETHMAKGEP